MPRKRMTESSSKKESAKKIEETLIQNLVELQKVHTTLLEKFDKLSNQLSALLQLFESAARSFAEHPANKVSEKDKDFLEKIDRLLDQNKTIAKGLMLMEDRMKQRVYGPNTSSQPMNQAKPLSANNSGTSESSGSDEYQPSSLTRPLPKF